MKKIKTILVYLVPLLFLLAMGLLPDILGWLGIEDLVLWYGLVLGGQLILIALTFLFLKQTKQTAVYHFPRIRWQAVVLTVAAFFFFYYFLPFLTQLLAQQTDNQQVIDSSLRSAIYNNDAVLILLILQLTIGSPILEEMVFRGVVMNTYFKNSSYYLDVLFSSVLFAFCHFWGLMIRPIDFLIYFTYGLTFGFLARQTKSIYYSIALHVCWNTFIYLYYFQILYAHLTH